MSFQITIEFENGEKLSFTRAFRLRSIECLYGKDTLKGGTWKTEDNFTNKTERKDLPPGKSVELRPAFAGLWYTSSGEFVEVISPHEAYFITKQGSRSFLHQISEHGAVLLDGKVLTLLMKSKRWDEEKVVGTDVSWPILKENR